MLKYSKWLMRIAAIYMLIGALIGADMAGRSSYSMVAGHAHILVVGWLTLFAYGMFYYVFRDKLSMKRTAAMHFWTSLLGGGHADVLPNAEYGNPAGLYHSSVDFACRSSFIYHLIVFR